MSIFEIATRRKYRFTSPVGELSIEQLWDLPLTASGNRPNLDNVARVVNADLKGVTEESFVSIRPDPRKAEHEIKLEIVKRIIAVKMEERDKATAAADRAEKRRKIADALAHAENAELANLSKDELLAKLAELDDAA